MPTAAAQLPKEESVGARLRRLRLQRGLSQRQLADARVSATYISRIEAGTREPSRRVLDGLAQKLGVTRQYLESGSRANPLEEQEARFQQARLGLKLGRDPGRAEEELRELLNEAVDTGDAWIADQARAILGRASLLRDDFQSAIDLLEPSIRLHELKFPVQRELIATLARALIAAGQADRAIGLLAPCLREIETAKSEARIDYMRITMLLAYANADTGDLQQAEAILSSALSDVAELSRPLIRARSYWAEAQSAHAEGDLLMALRRLRRAAALLESVEDAADLARAHLLWADLVALDDRAEEANVHLGLAESLISHQAEDGDELNRLRTEQARRAVRRGDADEAVAKAREAISLVHDDRPAELGIAYWSLGQGLAMQGNLDDSVSSLERAIELLSRVRRPRDVSQASLSLGRVLRQAGRHQDASEAFERAAEAATSLLGELPRAPGLR